MSLAIKELPVAERPRERLRSHGAHALSSSELLAILLGSGSEGRSALGIGQEILSTCRGSLRLLATDGRERFARVGSRFLNRVIEPDEVELVDL